MANVHTAPDPLANVAAYIEHYQLEEAVSSALKDVVKSRTRTPILAMIDSLSRAQKVEMAAKHAAATQIQAHCRGHSNRVCRGKSVGHIGTRVKVLVSMDPGQDLDDEMFLILLSARACVEHKVAQTRQAGSPEAGSPEAVSRPYRASASLGHQPTRGSLAGHLGLVFHVGAGRPLSRRVRGRGGGAAARQGTSTAGALDTRPPRYARRARVRRLRWRWAGRHLHGARGTLAAPHGSLALGQGCLRSMTLTLTITLTSPCCCSRLRPRRT